MDEKEIVTEEKQLGNNSTSLFNKILWPINKLNNLFSGRLKYYGPEYKIFAYFILASFIFPYFMWSHANYVNLFNQDISLTLRFLSVALAFTILIFEYMPKKLRDYFSLYWYFSLTYCLPFLTVFLFLYNKATPIWIVNIGFSIFMLAVLTDLLSFILTLTIGSFCGYKFFLYVSDVPNVDFLTNQPYNLKVLIYSVVFSSLIGLIFSKSKRHLQRELNSRLEEATYDNCKILEESIVLKSQFIDSLKDEIKTPVMGVVSYSQILLDYWDSIPEDKKKELCHELYLSSDKFYDYVSNLLALSNINLNQNVKLNLSEFDLKQTLLKIISRKHIFPKKVDMDLKIQTNRIKIIADEFKINQVIKILLYNAVKLTKYNNIVISLIDHNEGLMLKIRFKNRLGSKLEEIFEVPKNHLKREKHYYENLVLARKIIDSHGFKIWAEKANGKFCFCLLIPGN